MPTKKQIIIIAVLGLLAMGLGYWYGMPKGVSGGGGGKEPAFLKKGLVAYYPFNGNAKDESGNGNDGGVKGATLTVDRNGESDRSYSFDGKDDLIEILPSQSISAMRSLGIAFWVKPKKAQTPALDGHIGLVTRWDRTNVTDWFGVWLNVDTVVTTTWPSEGIQQSAPLQKDVWQHIVYTHDTYGASIYVDGELKSQLGKLPISLRETNIPIIIGADNFQSERMHRFFSGQLDDIRIYNRALSEAEVKELYEFEKPKAQQASTATFTSDPSNADNVKIEAAIRKAAGKPTGTLTKADLEKVKDLNLFGNQISDVNPLRELTQLRQLDLRENQISDVTPLKDLTHLGELSLGNNQISDVSPLKELTKMISCTGSLPTHSRII